MKATQVPCRDFLTKEANESLQKEEILKRLECIEYEEES